LLGRVLQGRDPAELPLDMLSGNMSDFVIAGTETTATCLATATYCVLRDSAVRAKLEAEVRGSFGRYEEITPETTTSLPYVNAVLDEAMRIMAPVPWTASRIVPKGGDTVDGYYIPEGVSDTKLMVDFQPLLSLSKN
jgi:cytochrome P450